MKTLKAFKMFTALASAIALVVLFQNCSGKGFETMSDDMLASTEDPGPEIPVGITEFNYPQLTSAFTVKPGDALTIKVLKPEGVAQGVHYWRIVQDFYSMAAYYGPVIEKDGYIYISFTVSPYFTGTQELRLFILNLETDMPITSGDPGFRFTVDATSTADHGVFDSVVNLCSVASAYAPALSFDREVTEIREALLIGDNGGGVGGASCTFTSTQGTKTVNCLNTVEWPSDWRTANLSVSARSRCNATTNRDFTYTAP